MKIIEIESCFKCPLLKKCKAWTGLTREQRIAMTISTKTPFDFILKDCHLEDK